MTLLIFVAACTAGTIQHFLYRPLGSPRWLAPLLPVSESPWEHYKLAFWPLCAALGAAALCLGVSWQSWALAALLACAHAFCTMFGIFYFYVYGLGVGRPLLAADIGGYYLTMGCGYALGLRALTLYTAVWPGVCALALLLAAAVLLARWSVAPPALPLFRDGAFSPKK